MGRRRARRGLAFGIVSVLAGMSFIQAAGATVPGQNGRLAITTQVEVQNLYPTIIQTMTPAGTDLVPLTDGETLSTSPAYTPDGKKVVFARDDLWVKDAKNLNSRERQLTFLGGSDPSNPVNAVDPAISPDGTSILFNIESPFDVGPPLRQVPFKGGTVTPLDVTAADPDISPDGKSIAVVVTDGGPGQGFSEIHLLNSDGTERGKVEADTTSVTDPSFSPDGSTIVFSGRVGNSGPLQVHTIGLDGSGLTRLTDFPEGAYGPVFSPDGRKIAFTEYRAAGETMIGVMNADGSGKRSVGPEGENATVWDWQRKSPFVISRMSPRKRTLRVKVFGPGRLIVSGSGIKRRVVQVRAARTVRVPLALRFSTRRRLARTGKALANTKVNFEPKGALPNTIERRLVLKTKR